MVFVIYLGVCSPALRSFVMGSRPCSGPTTLYEFKMPARASHPSVLNNEGQRSQVVLWIRQGRHVVTDLLVVTLSPLGLKVGQCSLWRGDHRVLWHWHQASFFSDDSRATFRECGQRPERTIVEADTIVSSSSSSRHTYIHSSDFLPFNRLPASGQL